MSSTSGRGSLTLAFLKKSTLFKYLIKLSTLARVLLKHTLDRPAELLLPLFVLLDRLVNFEEVLLVFERVGRLVRDCFSVLFFVDLDDRFVLLLLVRERADGDIFYTKLLVSSFADKFVC